MTQSLYTERFKMEYIESEIRQPLLWESHCHAQFEMIAVVDGDITVVLEGQPYRLRSNRVIIIPPLCYHSVTANGKGSYRRITALFGMDAVPDELQSRFSAHAGQPITPSASLERMKTICQHREREFYTPLLYSLLVEIFYDVQEERTEPAAALSDVFLQSVLPYIDENLHRRILLDELAKVSNRSKSSFCHLFEEKMKISPKQYILQKKLALACKLIDEGVPRTVAAMRVGYENYSNFYRVYSKHFGTSPTRKRSAKSRPVAARATRYKKGIAAEFGCNAFLQVRIFAFADAD